MDSVKKSTRAYSSPRREAQAQATRAAIVEAARSRFVADGYTSTTIDAVAQDAQVSAATVYGVFGNKRALLKATMDVAIVGDLESVPLQGRDWVQALAAIDDVDERVRRVFAGLRGVYERTAGLQRVVEEAAATDAELAEVAAGMGRGQREETSAFIRLVAGDLRLFPEIPAKDERDAIWAVTGLPVYRRLTEECGWSPARWERWAVSLVIALLAAARSR